MFKEIPAIFENTSLGFSVKIKAEDGDAFTFLRGTTNSEPLNEEY